MADTVTSQTIIDGAKTAIVKFTNESDGTGEASVKKVDVSALSTNGAGDTCSSVTIKRIYWACRGMGVDIEFDASTNVLAICLPADSTGDEEYDTFGGIPNNAGSGKTGDIDFTTVSASSGDAYSIILVLTKNY
tara:strand:- start:1738 stop:2139 length:402 start_codon:yes stop_codon:yes gene_type:complete